MRDLSQKLREDRVFQGLGVVNTVSCHEKAKEDKDQIKFLRLGD